MEGYDFPSILPLEANGPPDTEVALEALLEAKRASSSALASDILSDDRDQLALLETTIQALDSATQTLRRHRDYLSARAREQANLGTPIARLPTETLCDIIQLFANGNPVRHQKRKLRVHRTWFIIGHVCRIWRRALFHMPDVWANDLFAFGPLKALTLSPFTKGSPLNVELYESHYDYMGAADHSWNEIVLLMKRARRIYVDELPSTEDAFRLMTILTAEPLSHLETVDITVSEKHISEALSAGLVMADHSNLRSLSLSGLYMQPSLLHTLVSLDLRLWELEHNQRPPLHSLLSLLERNPGLRELTLVHSLDQDDTLEWSSPRVLLPSLRSICLYHGLDELSLAFLDHLEVPALERANIQPDAQFIKALHIYRSMLLAWHGTVDSQTGLTELPPLISECTNHRNLRDVLSDCMSLLTEELGVQFSIKQHKRMNRGTIQYMIRRRALPPLTV
ncbi:hypothetical protein PENSPDRAFT_749196 [Peniophora sp. CONT]|nr:hypothetical protein PENSPDRAFT_749196 [Peniophora sp. CONT]